MIHRVQSNMHTDWTIVQLLNNMEVYHLLPLPTSLDHQDEVPSVRKIESLFCSENVVPFQVFQVVGIQISQS